MKKIFLASFAAIVLTTFMACSADTLVNSVDSSDNGPTDLISNKKADATKTTKSSDASSSSRSADKSSSSSSDKE